MTKATLCGGKKKTKTTFVNTKISFKTSQQMRTGLKNGKKKNLNFYLIHMARKNYSGQ